MRIIIPNVFHRICSLMVFIHGIVIYLLSLGIKSHPNTKGVNFLPVLTLIITCLTGTITWLYQQLFTT